MNSLIFCTFPLRRVPRYGSIGLLFRQLFSGSGGSSRGRYMSDLRKRIAPGQQGEPCQQQVEKSLETEPSVSEGSRSPWFPCTNACVYSLHPFGKGEESGLIFASSTATVHLYSSRLIRSLICSLPLPAGRAVFLPVFLSHEHHESPAAYVASAFLHHCSAFPVELRNPSFHFDTQVPAYDCMQPELEVDILSFIVL